MPSTSSIVEPLVPDSGQPAAHSFWEKISRGSQGWLLSLTLHMLVLIALGLWYLPPLAERLRPELLSQTTEADEEIDDFQPLVIDALDIETEPVELEVQPEIEVLAEEVSLSTLSDLTSAPSFTELSPLGDLSAPAVASDLLGFDGTGTTGRGKMSRTAVMRRGGNSASELAIEQALTWIAEHQNPDGSWSLVHTGGLCNGRCANPANVPAEESLRAGTGLALLPFLGAGHTPRKGRHRRVVARGIAALVAMSKREKVGASWRDPRGAGGYSHPIASIVLSEAFAMSGDSALGGAAQSAIDHIVAAQGADGGWRYEPLSVPGDTSVVGWNVMALKSAYLAGLSVPPRTVAGAANFMDLVALDQGTEYTYIPNPTSRSHGASPARNAIGLLCRMYLGWRQEHPSLEAGVQKLAAIGPSKDNYYYNYYASQVLFQFTGGKGSLWREWNTQLRDLLIDQQETEGHARGSWYQNSAGAHSARGGRLFMTSLATMTLEVYYRYLPIYQTEAVEKGFPE